MENSFNEMSYLDAGNALTIGVASDLNNLLSSIKERASVMMNSITPSHPFQEHLKEIMMATDKSIETADILLNFAMVTHHLKSKE